MRFEKKHFLMFQSEKRLVSAALNFACFLIDAGWYLHAESVLQRIETIPGYEAEVGLKLLHVFGAYSKFSEAEAVFRRLLTSVTPFAADVNFDAAGDDAEVACRQRLRSVSTSSSMMTDDDESDTSSLALSRTSSLDG